MDLVALSDVAATLGLGADAGHHHVAVVGGGGKTTLVHALGRQLGGRRVLTCTTKMGHDQHRGLPLLLDPTDDEVVAATEVGAVMVWQGVAGHKALGVEPEACDRWFELVDHVLIEADGSRRRPFKAPADYEPVVPSTATLMVSVIGADALGGLISEVCHRPEIVAELTGAGIESRLDPELAATVLLHERGARKELPSGAQFTVVVTKVTDASQAPVEALIGALGAQEPELRTLAIESYLTEAEQGRPR
jgi:probable selenium-dependent hydroxylase accessory protein YqeC